MIDTDFDRYVDEFLDHHTTRPREAAEEIKTMAIDVTTTEDKGAIFYDAPEVEPVPLVGELVLYKLPHNHAPMEVYSNGMQTGDVLPALIVRRWSNDVNSALNLRVFCDGPHDAWLTSVMRGDGPGQWQWPLAQK